MTLFALQQNAATAFSFHLFYDMFHQLTQLGLTEKEATLYMTMLRIGPSPVSTLAKRSNIKRVSLYSILNSLCERGLITFEQSKMGRRYIPYDPESLLYNLERESAQIKFRMQVAKDCIQELANMSFTQATTWQKTFFHLGSENIRDCLNEYLSPKIPLFIIFLMDGVHDCSVTFLTDYLRNKGKFFKSTVELYVHEHDLKSSKEFYPYFECKSFKRKIGSTSGQLLIQEDSVYFLFTSQGDVKLMVLKDKDYAAYIKEVLLGTA